VTLACTLFEFYNGSFKSFTFKRDKLMPDGRSLDQVEETMQIEVKPGFDTDTEIVFPSRGHEKHAYFNSALKVKFSLKHVAGLAYRRHGSTLVYTQTLTLQDALMSAPFQVKTLDGRILKIGLDRMITPDTEHRIEGEGMPGKVRGDMLIKFDI